MKQQDKCPFCEIPCGEDHCAWKGEAEPTPKDKPKEKK